MRISAQFGLRLLLAFAVIFAAGVLGFALPRFGGSLPLLILPSGFAVAAMYRWGRRLWPAVFAAGTVTDLWAHQPLVTALAVGTGLAAGAALTAWLLEQRDFDPSFSRGKDVVGFILAAALGMVAPPTLGLFGDYLGDPGPTTIHAVDWIRWWSNTTVGVLLVAPALVAVTQRSFAQFASHRVAGFAWVLGVIFCCAAISVLPNIPAAHGYGSAAKDHAQRPGETCHSMRSKLREAALRDSNQGWGNQQHADSRVARRRIQSTAWVVRAGSPT